MENIEENNRLIAEFMGHPSEIKEYGDRPLKFLIKQQWTGLQNLKFDSSWDWLMPVVEKIEGMHFDVSINGYGSEGENSVCDILDGAATEITMTQHQTKIMAVYLAVVEFIEWYNKQK